MVFVDNHDVKTCRTKDVLKFDHWILFRLEHQQTFKINVKWLYCGNYRICYYICIRVFHGFITRCLYQPPAALWDCLGRQFLYGIPEGSRHVLAQFLGLLLISHTHKK